MRRGDSEEGSMKSASIFVLVTLVMKAAGATLEASLRPSPPRWKGRTQPTKMVACLHARSLIGDLMMLARVERRPVSGAELVGNEIFGYRTEEMVQLTDPKTTSD